MKLAFICPVAHLWDIAVYSNYHLVLAHMVVADESYREFYLARSQAGDYITLDNSSYEMGDNVYTPGELVEIALSVGAKEVMAPEVYRDGKRTAECVEDFVSKVRKVRGCAGQGLGVFATVHGNSMSELEECCKQAVKMGVNTIGVSCRLSHNYFDFGEKQTIHANNESMDDSLLRVAIVRRLIRLSMVHSKPGKIPDFHLLGLNHPYELSFYPPTGLVRSNDSSCAYLAAVHNRPIDFFYEKVPDKLNFNDRRQSKLGKEGAQFIVRVQHNIKLLKRLAGDI